MRVRDWMTGPVLSVRPEESLHDAEALMRQHRIRHLPVLYQGTLVGILSDRDLQSALPSPTTTLSVGEIRFYLARGVTDSPAQYADRCHARGGPCLWRNGTFTVHRPV